MPTVSPTPNMASAQILPRNPTPAALVGSLNSAPTKPITAPAPRIAALRPPVSPALIVSAAAIPAGHDPVAGSSLESNTRYSTQLSTARPMTAPPSMGHTRSLRPRANGTAIGVSRELAAAKVEPEIADCTRFCRCLERIRVSTPTGIRPMSIATRAPITAVLGDTPSEVISTMPIRAPRTDSTMVRMRVTGSKALGCDRGGASAAAAAASAPAWGFGFMGTPAGTGRSPDRWGRAGHSTAGDGPVAPPG
ncbi:hypothetical protein SANTM175S_00645 [Streptomyces antimycoticus]